MNTTGEFIIPLILIYGVIFFRFVYAGRTGLRIAMFYAVGTTIVLGIVQFLNVHQYDIAPLSFPVIIVAWAVVIVLFEFYRKRQSKGHS